ncbi:MAG: rod shape-determining protein MreD [Patescibacteria group bacterium]
MRIFLIIIFILLILFLQIGILPQLKIFGAWPNLILISILALSILQGWKKTLPWIIVGGLFLDFYSLHNILGASIVALLVVSYLVYFLSQNTFKKTTFFPLILIFLIAIFVYNILLIIIFEIFDISFDWGFLTFIIGLIYNLILALPIFYLIKKYA